MDGDLKAILLEYVDDAIPGSVSIVARGILYHSEDIIFVKAHIFLPFLPPYLPTSLRTSLPSFRVL